jgi:hypothetical protein
MHLATQDAHLLNIMFIHLIQISFYLLLLKTINDWKTMRLVMKSIQAFVHSNAYI